MVVADSHDQIIIIGHPDFDHIGPIVCEALKNPIENSVVVVGHGNVALDCARILAKGSPGLVETDMASRALPVLGSGVSRVSIVGRRGHAQAAFTIKEVRELAKLEAEGHEAFFRVRQEELDMGLTDASNAEINNSRPRSRIHKLLQECASKGGGKGNLSLPATYSVSHCIRFSFHAKDCRLAVSLKSHRICC